MTTTKAEAGDYGSEMCRCGHRWGAHQGLNPFRCLVTRCDCAAFANAASASASAAPPSPSVADGRMTPFPYQVPPNTSVTSPPTPAPGEAGEVVPTPPEGNERPALDCRGPGPVVISAPSTAESDRKVHCFRCNYEMWCPRCDAKCPACEAPPGAREMVEALRPFARLLDAYEADDVGFQNIANGYVIDGIDYEPPRSDVVITIGDLRRAREALRQYGETMETKP